MVLPGLFPTGAENNLFMIVQTVISLLFFGMIFFFPRIMVWQTDRKMRDALIDLDAYRDNSQMMFLAKFTDNFEKYKKAVHSDDEERIEAAHKEIENRMDSKTVNKFHSLKDFKFSPPTGIDPAGLVGKLENVLDASESKFNRFIEENAHTEDEERKADLSMAFKGVMGTHQMYKVMRHFRLLIKKTGNFQLIGLVQMMVPIYKEVAQSQKEATRAFVDGAPIGDAIGPLVAAKLITAEPEEVAEDIIHAEEVIEDKKVHVIKSNGPGARLGKYGDAIEKVAEENSVDAIITVDAGAKFEGEETGSLSEGVGVMMGGPGVEKSKIEEVAHEHDIPLEGIVIKQSAPEASKPMKKEIYDSYQDAVSKVEELVSEQESEVIVVGVGNTCGVGNQRSETTGVPHKLQKYWDEYEKQDEEEVSYMGMLGALPGGDQQSQLQGMADNLIWNMVR